MMDTGLLATVPLTFFYISADSPEQVDPYLDPRMQVCLPITHTAMLQKQQSLGPLHRLLLPSYFGFKAKLIQRQSLETAPSL
jgi:hypothetical protein